MNKFQNKNKIVFKVKVEDLIFGNAASIHLQSLRRINLLLTLGIACKKISCYMRDSACSWLVVENTKIFQSFVKYFLIFPRICE